MKTPTLLLIDISRAIRQVGEIWLIQKTEAGMLFRATVNRQQIRVLSQLPGSPPPDFPPDHGAPLHIATTVSALTDFLHSCSDKANAL